MEKVIYLKDEEVRIMISDVSKDYDVSIKGAIIQCIKHIYRYNEITMPKDVMIAILWEAHKGCNCNKSHLDITQQLSLYEYLKDKEINDPYIQQFLKETKENCHVSI